MMRRPSFLLVVFCLATAATSPVQHAQQAARAPARPVYDHSAAPDVATEIHIGGDCRIVPNPSLPVRPGKSKPFRDDAICSLEGTHSSQHEEERIEGNQLLRWHVEVNEQTFVLQNPSENHVVFLVERTVPKGWMVDSDPQPNRYTGSTAIFPVHAQPGEMVRLHVGIRRMTPLKPKTL
jgi:hypothetical protein